MGEREGALGSHSLGDYLDQLSVRSNSKAGHQILLGLGGAEIRGCFRGKHLKTNLGKISE